MELVRSRHAALADPHPRRRSRTRSPRSPARAGRPTASCTCSRSPARPASRCSTRRLRHDRRAHPDRRRPQAGRALRRRPTCTRPAASAWSCASWSAPASSTARARGRRRPLARARSPPQVARAAGPGRRRLVAAAAQADAAGSRSCAARSPRRAAVVKLAGHERLLPPRPGARLRLRGGVLRRGQGALDRARRRWS